MQLPELNVLPDIEQRVSVTRSRQTRLITHTLVIAAIVALAYAGTQRVTHGLLFGAL